MGLLDDPTAIIGTSCRLPGGITHPSMLWDAFCDPQKFAFSTNPPPSRTFASCTFSSIRNAGWIGPEGVELFDRAFFNITPGEGETLRPNVRLALELTWEALENAGIPPSTLKGKNVSTFIAVGTEDGWDMRRYAEDGQAAFNHHWAASSDPSGVSGRVAHFLDLHGPTASVSSGCSSAAMALRDGISSLYNDDSEYAIVGATTTHFSPAAIDWAAAVGVASKQGRCSAFSEEADGYVPSEGAVFMILRKSSAASSENPILGLIRSLTTGHNGATRTLTTPNVDAQVVLTRRSLSSAGLSTADITVLESHGTGTRLGDALEMEAVRSVYGAQRKADRPLLVSSSKTVFGHCQAASAFVGILKLLSCFEHKALPPHHVEPLLEYTSGSVQIPRAFTPLQRDKERPFVAQVNSFGFTGSIASIIIEEAPQQVTVPSHPVDHHPWSVFLLPFSAKTMAALYAQIRQVCSWARVSHCNMYDLAAVLALARDHHPIRRALLVSQPEDLDNFARDAQLGERTLSSDCFSCSDDVRMSCGSAQRETLMQLLNLEELDPKIWTVDMRCSLDALIDNAYLFQAACLLYEHGHTLRFSALYRRKELSHHLIRTLPMYPFDRSLCWRPIEKDVLRMASKQSHNFAYPSSTVASHTPEGKGLPGPEYISEIVGSIVHTSIDRITPDTNIFDLGIDSLNGIELAETLSKVFGRKVTILDLYRLLTVKAIYASVSGSETAAASPYNFTQSHLDDWIERFGSALPELIPPVVKLPYQGSFRTVLLTGANGMLGSQLLCRLLESSSTRVFCLVRGDPWTRLSSAFKSQDLDPEILHSAKAARRLVALHTSDLSDELLGCVQDDYRQLTDSVDEIAHVAWKVDFNLPVSSFESCLEGTRNLAQLSLFCRKPVRMHFISSFSASFGYDGDLVPECSLQPLLAYSIPQGYAISKLIAEHSLYRLLKRSPNIFKLNIIRVGQVCGHSLTGSWSRTEMIPSIIASIPVLRAVPDSLPDVSWIPSDVCADTLRDLVLSPLDTEPLRVHNVANPTVIPWVTAVRMIGEVSGLGEPSHVTLEEYIQKIQGARESQLPISRLLPYFISCQEDGGLPGRYCSLEVKATLRFSQSLAQCPPIMSSFMATLVNSILSDPTDEPSIADIADASPVFIFGPWSSWDYSMANHEGYRRTHTRVRALAARARSEIGFIQVDVALDQQLETLIAQIIILEDFLNRGIVPRAVVGYCYGEYAAAITSGILSEETAINVIVRRAAVLQNVTGAMLNVFDDPASIRRYLASLPSPPDVAIMAGPQHVVLSGSASSIKSAHEKFQAVDIKAILVNTSIPFHSVLMDNCARSLVVPHYQCNPHQSVYVSGVTGSALPGQRLGPKYWARHMREPVRFFQAMQYVRTHFTGAPVVDIGPGNNLTKIISRYKWDDLHVFTAKEYLSGRASTYHARRMIPMTSPPTPSTQLGISPTMSHQSPARSGSPVNTAVVIPETEGVLQILSTLFGYRPTHGLLQETFHSLGIQSLDFIRFSQRFSAFTGKTLPPSSYTSNESIEQIIHQVTGVQPSLLNPQMISAL